MSVIKSFAVLLVGLLVTVNALSSERCQAKCDKSYSEQTHQLEQNEPCKRGCRLFSIHDATRHVDPFFPFDLKHIGFTDRKDETLNKCSKDCSSAYEHKDNTFVNACMEGCRNGQVADNEQTGIDDGFKDGFTISFGNPGLFDFNTNIFDDLDRMITRTRSNFPSIMNFSQGNKDNGKPKSIEAGQEGTSPFHSMFDSVHRNVQSLMQNVLGRFNQHMTKDIATNDKENAKEQTMEMHANSAINSEGQQLQGGGKLVVIQDGPGYHQEKTYNFGPKADVGKIFNEQLNDMMSHNNPLENFLKPGDVEMIDPLNSSKQKEEEKEENKKEPSNLVFDLPIIVQDIFLLAQES